ELRAAIRLLRPRDERRVEREAGGRFQRDGLADDLAVAPVVGDADGSALAGSGASGSLARVPNEDSPRLDLVEGRSDRRPDPVEEPRLEGDEVVRCVLQDEQRDLAGAVVEARECER